MKTSALAFVLLAITPIAQASGAGDFSLLRCGVVVGGTTLTYTKEAASKSRYDTRMNHVLGAVSKEPVEFTPPTAEEPIAVGNSKPETRLPRNFTLATLGCSWR